MIGEDLTNHAVLAHILRFCPKCDPRIDNPIRCEPRQCSCGTNLYVVTASSIIEHRPFPKIVKAKRPVAEVTGADR